MNPFKNSTSYHRANENLHSMGGGNVDETGEQLTALGTQASAMNANMTHVATTADLKDLGEKMATLETRLIEKLSQLQIGLIRWMAGIGLTSIGIVVSLLIARGKL
jgi:hypothetical protein